MEKNTKRYFWLVAFGVILFAVVMNIGVVFSFLKKTVLLILPVFLGFIIAFILNVPMSAFERMFAKIFAKSKKMPKEKTISVISLLLTIVCVVLVITLIFTMLIPELVSSVTSLYNLILKRLPKWIEMFKSYNIDTTKITEWFNTLNTENIVDTISNSAGTLITKVITFASSAVSAVIQFVISIIIAIYVLLSKRELGRHIVKILDAHLKEKTAQTIYYVCSLTSRTFSKFLSGQSVEACILGILVFIALSVFGIPYASIIGVLTAVCAFIPYVGAFISCFIGAFLILLVNPSQVITCVIVYLVVQFIENQFIYPHVVGNSVGLSPLLTLIAVLIGGSLMGVFGMIFFIPLCAVIVTLIKDHTNEILSRRQENKTSK